MYHRVQTALGKVPMETHVTIAMFQTTNYKLLANKVLGLKINCTDLMPNARALASSSNLS